MERQFSSQESGTHTPPLGGSAFRGWEEEGQSKGGEGGWEAERESHAEKGGKGSWEWFAGQSVGVERKPPPLN